MSKPTPQAGFGIPLSEGPIVFGYRHGEGQPENFMMLNGEQAQTQRAACSDASMLREVPESDWELNGFEKDIYKGESGDVKVLVHKFDKTAQLLEEQAKHDTAAADIDKGTQANLEEQLKLQQAQIADLMELVKNKDSDKLQGEAAAAKKLKQDTAQAKAKASA